jgi:Flp pilus assembly protein TadG
MALTANRTGLEGMAHVFRRPMQSFLALARQVPRFISAQDGGTEFVEFAIVILPFLAVVIAIFQISYFLFAQQTLQTAAAEFGRQFMTNQGPAQNATVNGNGQLKSTAAICNIISPLLSCGSVVVNVQSYQDYQSANTSAPSMYDNNCNAINSWNYTAGNPGQVVVIQLMYPLRIITGPLGFGLSNVCNGNMMVMGVTAIRVEPS